MQRITYATNAEELFWSHVEKKGPDECWEWTAQRNWAGYGRFTNGARKMQMAHRFSYALNICPIPDGFLVLHRCDNPPCVNPAHLFLGSHRDNVADCKAKERRGRMHASLDAEAVAEIRRREALGETQASLARGYGVHRSTISRIIRGRSWASAVCVVLIAITILIGAPVTAQARNGHPPCDGRRVRQIHPALGIPEVQARVRLLIKCAVRRFPVSGGRTTAYCIANRESHFYPWAKNAQGSGSWGTFQVIASTWASWWSSYPMVRRWIRHAYHGDPAQIRLDPYANVILSIRAMHDSEAPWMGGSYAC